MTTEIFIEGRRLDITADESSLFTFAIDDVKDFASRQTSFSKTIVLPGTANNNSIFGNIFELGISNDYNPLLDNNGYNFNAFVAASCFIFQNNIQTFKGTIRLLEIDKTGPNIEYQVAINGDLVILNVALSSALLEDLDFSEYDQEYNVANITTSWDNAPGSGVYFPMVDLGTYSVDKHNWDFRTFRPALYVKEYIDKMFAASGYAAVAVVAATNAGNAASAAAIAAGLGADAAAAAYTLAYNTAYSAAAPASAANGFRYQCDLFNTDRFKRLIVPHNKKILTKLTASILNASSSTTQHIINHTSGPNSGDVVFLTIIGGFFTNVGGQVFTYNGTDTITTTLNIHLDGKYNFKAIIPPGGPYNFEIIVKKNNVNYYYDGIPMNDNSGLDTPYAKDYALSITLNTGDTFEISYQLFGGPGGPADVFVNHATLGIVSASVLASPLDYNEVISMEDCIPQNIRQVDFLVSIVKMFNLYVYEDQFDERLIKIAPFVDYYSTGTGSAVDWTYKMNRNKTIKIVPLSEMTSRIYNFNYAKDSDYWNDLYQKRYNQVYGSKIYDSLYQFATETNTLELIFASTPLVGYVGEDKVYPTIFKLSGTTEDTTDSVIRIMQTKKVTGVTTWHIVNSTTNAIASATLAATTAFNNAIAAGSGIVAAQAAYNAAYNAIFLTFSIGTFTTYGYAGHLDDPDNPDNDLNFGALNELFFTLVAGDLSKTQFNIYWSSYMAEITDKDSKMLTANFYLTPIDIFNLDFSKYVMVDSVLFRLNKITDYNATVPSDCEVQLLKVIQTSYSFPPGTMPGNLFLEDADNDALLYDDGRELLYT